MWNKSRHYGRQRALRNKSWLPIQFAVMLCVMDTSLVHLSQGKTYMPFFRENHPHLRWALGSGQGMHKDNIKHPFSGSIWSREQEVIGTLQKKWLCCVLDLWLVTERSILSLLPALSVSSSCRGGSLTQLQLLLILHSTQQLPAAPHQPALNCCSANHCTAELWPAQHRWRMSKSGSHTSVFEAEIFLSISYRIYAGLFQVNRFWSGWF